MKKEKITKRRRTMCSSYRVQSAVMQRAHRFIIARRRCIGRRGRREAKVRALGCVCYETIAQELVSRPNTIFLLSILVCFVCFFVPPPRVMRPSPGVYTKFPTVSSSRTNFKFSFFWFRKRKETFRLIMQLCHSSCRRSLAVGSTNVDVSHWPRGGPYTKAAPRRHKDSPREREELATTRT